MGHNPLHVVGLILCPQFVRLGGYKFSKVGVAITSAGHPTLRENTFYYPLFHFIFDFARAAWLWEQISYFIFLFAGFHMTSLKLKLQN